MSQKGFSLIEMNVCCVIIAVLFAVSYPNFGKMRQAATFRNEIQTLYGNLQHAKIEAIKQNSYVVFDVSRKGYTIFVDDGAGGGIRGDWQRQSGEEILTSHQYSQNIEMVNTTFHDDHGRFRPIAGIKPGRITLSHRDSDTLREVVLSSAGRIRTAKL